MNNPQSPTATSQPACELCGSSRQLGYAGIMHVYLAPHWICAIFIPAGLGLGIFLDTWYLVLAVAGLIWPLANADFRMLLFPVVLIGKLSGKLVNCPRCEPGANIFRRE